MRLSILALAIWCFAGEAYAQEHVSLSPDGDRVVIRYRFDHPTAKFDFDTLTPPEARLNSAESDVLVSRAGLSATSPRTEFVVTVQPDRIRTDATYPVLTRVGEGWMLYLPSILARSPAELPENVVSTSQGWSILAGPAQASFNGFIYIGPAGRSSGGVIADPSLPKWLIDDARDAAEVSNADYGSRLELVSPGHPVLLVSPLPDDDRSSYVGDVTPNGVINLQFARRGVPLSRDQRFTDLVQPFVAHEVFHNWQAGKFRPVEGVNARWLDEGAAEYFSLVAQATKSSDASKRSRGILAGRLGACFSKMEDQHTGLLSLEGTAAQSTRYDCGVVVHWLVDIAKADKGGAWAVWRALLTSDDRYTVTDFLRAAVDPDPDRGLDSLLRSGTDVRRNVLASLVGQVKVADPSPSAWVNAATWPLLETNCSGQRGVLTTEDGRWILDSGNRCGALSGDPEILGIGDDMFADAGAKAYLAVAAACEAGGDVEVVLKTSEAVRRERIGCRRTITPPAPAYEVMQLL